MKKELFYVFAMLILISISLTGCVNLSARPEEAFPAEVPNVDYQPRRWGEEEARWGYPENKRVNTQIGTAQGAVYAQPAKSRVEDGARELPPPVYAISGVKNQEIHEIWENVDIVLILPEKDSFNRRIPGGTDVIGWIQNDLHGLEARIHEVKKGAKNARIYISGKSTQTMRETIRVLVPAEFLKSGQPRQFTSPSEEETLKAWNEQQEKLGN